jgi:hypothetical protein
MIRRDIEIFLRSGGRLISKKRLDEVYYNSIEKKYLIDFYIGNRLSGETSEFMWEFLNTFKKK